METEAAEGRRTVIRILDAAESQLSDILYRVDSGVAGSTSWLTPHQRPAQPIAETLTRLRNVLSFIEDRSKIPLSSLLGEQEQGLWTELLGEPTPTADEVGSFVHSLKEAIHTRLALERAAEPVVPRALFSARDETTYSPAAELALFASATDRFCSSWPFRLATVALLATAGFAVAGTFVFGKLEFDLRKELGDTASRVTAALEKSATESRNDIDGATKSAREAIASQQQTLSNLNKDLADKFSSARTELERQTAEFEKLAIQLKDRTISESAELVKRQLRDPQSELRSTININKQEVLEDLKTASGEAVKAIADRLVDLREKLTAREGDVEGVTTRIAGARGALDRLQAAGLQVDAIERAVARISAADEAARLASLGSSASAREATNNSSVADREAKAASGSRRAVDDLLSATRRDLDADQRSLGALQERLKFLQAQTSAIEEASRAQKQKTEKDPPAPAGGQGQGAPARPEPPSSEAPAEAALGGSTWKLIQLGLRASKFKLGIDGLKGPSTTAAIRGYQERRGDQATGVLTTIERDDLLVLGRGGTTRPPRP